MSKQIKDLRGGEKVIAWLVIWVIVAIALLVIGVGVIKFLQWAF